MYVVTAVCLLAAVGIRSRGAERGARVAWVCAIYACMLTQIALLVKDGTWSPNNGLPLHLCGFSGVLSLPALLWRSAPLTRFFRRLAAPGAVVALAYPTVYPTSNPTLATLAFITLHSLLACTPLFVTGARGGRTGMYRLCLALILSAIAVNRICGANYLFLRAVPSDTALSWLGAIPEPMRALIAVALAVTLSYVRKPAKTDEITQE